MVVRIYSGTSGEQVCPGFHPLPRHLLGVATAVLMPPRLRRHPRARRSWTCHRRPTCIITINTQILSLHHLIPRPSLLGWRSLSNVENWNQILFHGDVHKWRHNVNLWKINYHSRTRLSTLLCFCNTLVFHIFILKLFSGRNTHLCAFIWFFFFCAEK